MTSANAGHLRVRQPWLGRVGPRLSRESVPPACQRTCQLCKTPTWRTTCAWQRPAVHNSAARNRRACGGFSSLDKAAASKQGRPVGLSCPLGRGHGRARGQVDSDCRQAAAAGP
jgi:hypothetical protein